MGKSMIDLERAVDALDGTVAAGYNQTEDVTKVIDPIENSIFYE